MSRITKPAPYEPLGVDCDQAPRGRFIVARIDRCACGAELGRTGFAFQVPKGVGAIVLNTDGGTIPAPEARSRWGTDGQWHAWRCPVCVEAPREEWPK